MVSPSFCSCIVFYSLWLVNEKVRNCYRSVYELHRLYLLHHANGQMQVYFIASSIKIITKCVLPCTNSSQPGWDLYMHALGLWFGNTAAAKSSSSNHNNRLVDHFHHVLIYVYAWTNRLTCFSSCNLPIHLLLCVNKLLLTSTWQQV